MLRKCIIKISTVLFISVLLTSQIVLAYDAASSKSSLRQITPDKPLIFFQLTGISSIISKDSNFWKQLEEAPFWELVFAEMEAQSKVKDIHLAIEPGTSILSYILGQDVVFVLPKFRKIQEISPLLMFKLKGHDSDMNELIVNSIKIGLANAAKTTFQYGNYKIAVIPMPEENVPFQLSCALLDDVFAIGLGDTTLKKVIDLMNASPNINTIKEDAEFSSIMERFLLPTENITGQYLEVFHINLAEIVAFVNSSYDMFQGAVPQEVRPVVEKALKWFDLVSSFSLTTSVTEEGIVGQSYTELNPNATSQNFLNMIQVEPEKLYSMKFVPEDVMGYNGTNLIDLKLIWDMSYKILSDFPQFGERLLGHLKQMQKNLQFDIEEGLLSWMDNELAFIYSENPTFSKQRISREICLVIKVTDMTKASQGMKDFTNIGVRRSKGEMTIQEHEYMGETIYELGHIPVPINPAYALVDGYLLISPSLEYIKKLIDCAAGREKGLKANPRFMTIESKLPERVNRLEFQDIYRYTETIEDTIAKQIGTEMPTWDDENLDLKKTMMLQAVELAKNLMRVFGASFNFTIKEDIGLKSKSLVQIEDLERVVPIIDPDDAKIARNLYIANRYQEAGMLDSALSRYKQVLDLEPDNWQASIGAAQILDKQDRTQQAIEYYSQTGFVPEYAWHVIGPFDNKAGEGFYTKYPPEDSVQLDLEYEGKVGIVRWEKQTDGVLDGFVDCQEIFEPDQWVTAYAWTEVISEETLEVELRVGSDDQIKVWLNGKEVIKYESPRAAQPDQDIVSVTLNQGENQLLVKVCNEELDWGFYLRFTDLNGNPLKNLETN